MMSESRSQSSSKYDIEKSRFFVAGYIAVIALALMILFRKFIFSDGMIISHDIIGFGVFWRDILRESLFGQGSVPAWNPWICCGVPFVEAIHGGIYYPLSLVDYCGSIFRAIGYNFILHFFLAGLFMYAAARQLGLSRLASATAGVIYMFSPCLISWVAPGHDGKIYVATYFPLLVLFVDRLLKRRRLFDAAMMGLIFGVIILTPHLQLAYYAACAVGLYAVYRIVTEYLRRKNGRVVLRATALFIGGIVLGLAIGAIQLLPSAAYLTTDSPRASIHKSYAFASQYSLREEEAFSQIVPEFSGVNLKSGEVQYWGKNSMKDNSESAGTIPLFLALLSFFIPGRRNKRFWGALGLLVFLYSLGPTTPVFGWLLKIIPYADSLAGPSTSMYIFAFCVAILAGISIQNLKDRPHDKPRRLKIASFLLWIGPVALGVIALLFTLYGRDMLLLYGGLFHPDIIPSDSTTPAKWTAALANLTNLKIGLWLAATALGLTAVAIRTSLGTHRKRLTLWILPLLIIIMGVYFNQRFIVTFNAERRFGDHPVIDVIRQYEGWNRTVAYGLHEGAFQFGWYRIPSTIGVHGKEPRWFFDLMGGYHRGNMFNSRFANLTGTRFIVCPSDRVVPPDAVEPIPADTVAALQQFTVLENPNRFPHAFLASRYRAFDTREEIYSEILNGSEDLRQIVYLEETPSLPLEAGPDAKATADIVYYGTDSVIVDVDGSCNTLLVLTDNWYSAWQVRLDNRPQKLYRAYGSFRAVEVPAGAHRVVFTYHSKTRIVGWWMTVAGLVLVGMVSSRHFHLKHNRQA